MELPRHLVSVWNPAYGADVMESHLRILRTLAEKFRGGGDEEEVYVWWGKIRSERRQAPLPNLDQILELEKELGAGDDVVQREMQMYITDYRSLYVAHVAEITAADVREDEEEDHIPEIYRQPGTNCDCWFRLWDIRRLISDDTLAVVAELRKLRNVAYHNQPVSIYGGMVNLPLIVTRPDEARYFDQAIRDQLTDGRHWVEFDAEYSGIGETERELREHCFGEDLWGKLDPGTRTFIATSEKLYRDHRGDMSFDFSPVLIGLAKAFEVQTNILFREVLKKMPAANRIIDFNRQRGDLCNRGAFSLAELSRLIGDEKVINDAVKRHIAAPENAWFAASLPAILQDLADARNPAAHSDPLDRAMVRDKRNRYLGVGCEGDLVKLSKVRLVP